MVIQAINSPAPSFSATRAPRPGPDGGAELNATPFSLKNETPPASLASRLGGIFAPTAPLLVADTDGDLDGVSARLIRARAAYNQANETLADLPGPVLGLSINGIEADSVSLRA